MSRPTQQLIWMLVGLVAAAGVGFLLWDSITTAFWHNPALNSGILAVLLIGIIFIFWQVIRTPAEKRDASALRGALAVLDRYLDIAGNRLAGAPYLGGDDFTLADVQFGHLLYRYFTLEIERPERKGLSAYYDRLVARPAYREHVMVPYDELRVGAA